MTTKLVYCNCTYARVIDKEVKAEVLAGLSSSGKQFTAVPDLCELAAKNDAQLDDIFNGEPVRLAACYKRAVKGLCHTAKVEWDDDNINVINMREDTAAKVLAAMLEEQP